MTNSIEHTLTFKTGKKSCYYDGNQSCKFLVSSRLGFDHYCSLFKEDLQDTIDKDRDVIYLKRCDQCLEEFS